MQSFSRFLLPTLFVGLVGLFASSAMATEAKVGYVDMNRVLNEIADGQSAKDKLKRDFEAKQLKLDKMQKELKAEKESFDKKQGMMKPDILKAKQEELQRKFVNLQQTYMALQKELMESETKVTKDLTDKIRRVVEQIGDKENFSMVLNIDNTVLYYKRHLEVTDKVIANYNKLYGKA